MADYQQEKHWRSIIKTISWRITATLTTFLIAYFIVGNFTIAISIGGIEFFSKIFLYYVHERAWNKVRVGFKAKPSSSDYQI